MNLKTFILSFTLIFGFTVFSQAQNSSSNNFSNPLIINVMVDANKNIYIENQKVPAENITTSIREIVNNTPALKYTGVHYRIFGDESLLLGTIMDVDNELIAAFNPTYTRSSRYLLNLKAHNLDGQDWVNQLNKLDLKAIKKY